MFKLPIPEATELDSVGGWIAFELAQQALIRHESETVPELDFWSTSKFDAPRQKLELK
jgi:hypothetical protein